VTFQVLSAPAGGVLKHTTTSGTTTIGTSRTVVGTMVGGKLTVSGLSVTVSGTYLVRIVAGNLAFNLSIESRGRRR
jgi:hypothetical protein